MTARLVSLVCVLLHLSTDVKAQDYLYTIRHTKIESSKIGNFVRCTITDSVGLIWLGTTQGVFRFDGFHLDRPDEVNNEWSVRSPDVLCMATDGRQLFVGTRRGINILRFKDFKSIPVVGYVDNGEAILSVSYDTASGFWWYREDGWLFNLKGSVLRQKKIELINPVHIITTDQGVWMSGHSRTHIGIRRLGTSFFIDKKTLDACEISRTGPILENPFLFKNVYGQPVYVHGDRGFVLPAMLRGSGYVTPTELNMTQREEVEGHRFMVYRTNQLVHEYSTPAGWKRAAVPLNITIPFTIQSIRISGNYLLVSTSAGLLTVRFRKNAFVPVKSTLIEQDGNYEDPRAICEDDNYIYLTGYHSINAWRKSDGVNRVINASDLLTHGALLHRGKLWLATEGNGLLCMDTKSGTYERLVKDTTSRNNHLITVVAWGDTILVGGYTSFNAYLPESGRFLEPRLNYQGIPVSEIMVKKILPLGDDKCLLGTERGIFIIDRSFRILQHILPTNKEYASDIQVINDVVIAPDGTYWAGTKNGVVQLDAGGKQLRHINTRNGLAGDFAASILIDRRGQIWAGTYEGLSYIDRSSGNVRNFFKADGLPDDEFNHSSALTSLSGYLFMGTVSGFIQFNPDMPSFEDRLSHQIKISRLEYGGGRKENIDLLNPYLEKSLLRIGPDVKYLKIHFFSDPLSNPEKSIYEYKIDGVHDDWMKMGETPVLNVDNARSGKYNLRVRLILGSGSNAILEKQFPLVVEQYFYTRPAFYVAIIGTMFIFILLYIRSVFQRDRKLRDVRRELAEDLHDEVGGYLSGMVMKIDLLSKGPLEAQLNPIRNLATKAVFGLKDGLWSLDTKTDTAQQLWDRFRRIAQETLAPLDIPYRFSSADGLAAVPLTLIEKRNLLYILKECVNNAVKHGDGKGVWFEWNVRPDGRHQIVVRNRIRPVVDEKIKDGLGQENIQRRCQRIRGRMVINQDNGIFTVEININFRHDQIGRD